MDSEDSGKEAVQQEDVQQDDGKEVDVQAQVRDFISLREEIESQLTSAIYQKSGKVDTDEMKGIQDQLESLRTIADPENEIQGRAITRLAEEISLLSVAPAKKSGSSRAKATGKKTKRKTELKLMGDREWVKGVLYLFQIDHRDDLSPLHRKKIEGWATDLERLEELDRKTLVSLTNLIKKYKVRHLLDRDEVMRRVRGSE